MTPIEKHVLGPVCHGIVHYTLAIFKIEGYFHYRYNSICVRGLWAPPGDGSTFPWFCTALLQTGTQTPPFQPHCHDRTSQALLPTGDCGQLAARTPQWTRVFPRGCSRRTALRSRGDGIPHTHPRASPRCWAGVRARWDRPGRSGSSSGWPQTWTGHSRGVLWSASPLPSRLLFAKVERNKVQNPGESHFTTRFYVKEWIKHIFQFHVVYSRKNVFWLKMRSDC